MCLVIGSIHNQDVEVRIDIADYCGKCKIASTLMYEMVRSCLSPVMTCESEAKPLPTLIGILVGMPVPPVLDLAYRWRHNRVSGWLRYVAPLSGGMFMLLPVWVLFGAAPVIGAAIFIVCKQFHLG